MASIIPSFTTLLKSIGSGDTFVPLTSVAGIVKGYVLYVDSEAMPVGVVVSNSAIPGVNVARTGRAASHGIGATVYYGPPSSFATTNPVGVPPAGSVAWVINTITGQIWVAQGDEAGPGAANRYWQLQVSTPGIGALGVRTVSVNPV